MQLHPFYDLIHHRLPVQLSIGLDDFHIVDILLKQLAGYIGQLPWNAGPLRIFKGGDTFLNLPFPPLCL